MYELPETMPIQEAPSPKRMDIKEFRAFGYLQEVNRRFFHPLGLALEVIINSDGSEVLGGIWDYREDPEGMCFADISTVEANDKAARVSLEFYKRQAPRSRLFGGSLQPTTNELE